jgi:hypothetical protein
MATCILPLALSLGACGEDSDFKQAFDKSFREKWRSSYVEACTKGAVASSSGHLATEFAHTICTCAMEYTDHRLTIREKMNPNSDKSRVVMAEAITACAAEAQR